MSSKIKSSFFVADDSIKKQVYQTFRVNSSEVKRDIKALQEWIKTQPHLPQDIDVDLLEKWLVRNKFKLESTKFRIEKYYSMKATNAKEIEKISSALPNETTQIMLPLPKLTNKLERLVILKMKNENLDSDEAIKKAFKLTLCLNEHSLYCDFNLGTRLIIDFEGVTQNQIKKSVIVLAPLAKPYLSAYFTRVSGIEYLNTPHVIEDLYKKAKAIVPSKMYSRIGIHKDLSSLHKNVGKAYLPPELGGELETSLAELQDMFHEEIKNNIETLEHILVNEIADESKRIGEKIGGLKYEEFIGMVGNFRKLSVD